jgi:hypothetical protein
VIGMPLKDKWVNKVDGVDYVMAQDVNDIAQAAITLEGEMQEVKTNIGNIEDALSAI